MNNMSDCGCKIEVKNKEESHVLILLLSINAIMFFVEMTLEIISESTALIADSLDMLADATVYGIGLYAVGKEAFVKVKAANISGIFQIILGVTKRTEIDWKGGGSFTYLKLKKYNQNFIEQIEKAKDTKALLQIWKQMKANGFLNYNVDIKKQDEHIEDFKKLTLKKQKQHLCELLDKNQLYVNRSSLNDTDFACTEEEKQITQDFYRLPKYKN